MWTRPVENGASVTSYQIMIRHADDVTFSQDLTGCDGSDGNIVNSQ